MLLFRELSWPNAKFKLLLWPFVQTRCSFVQIDWP